MCGVFGHRTSTLLRAPSTPHLKPMVFTAAPAWDVNETKTVTPYHYR